jgi:hypothetical protein
MRYRKDEERCTGAGVFNFSFDPARNEKGLSKGVGIRSFK